MPRETAASIASNSTSSITFQVLLLWSDAKGSAKEESGRAREKASLCPSGPFPSTFRTHQGPLGIDLGTPILEPLPYGVCYTWQHHFASGDSEEEDVKNNNPITHLEQTEVL